jgi:two-component system response regulator TctD
MLVVEDNAVQRCIIQSLLTDANMRVDSVASGGEFRRKLTKEEYDVLIIDLSLPDVDGLTLIKELRDAHDSKPIVVISGRSTLPDKVCCLEAGADDYLVKPFSHVELLARVRAVTRRAFRIRSSTIRVGGLSIDERAGEVACAGKSLAMSPSEFKLLVLLSRNLGRTVSRDAIANLLDSRRCASSASGVDKLVSRLRRALSAGSAGVGIRTVSGIGYRLDIGDPTRRDLASANGSPNRVSWSSTAPCRR